MTLEELLCWDWSDMIVLAQNVRARTKVDQKTLSNSTLRKVYSEWSPGDFGLYSYFSAIFQKQVDKFGKGKLENGIKRIRSDRENLKKLCDEVLEKIDEQKFQKTCTQIRLQEKKYIERLLQLKL